jgi:hypothetical protein
MILPSDVIAEVSIPFPLVFLTVLPPALFVRVLHPHFHATNTFALAKLQVPRVFPVAHTVNALPPCAPFVLGVTRTLSSNALPSAFGTIHSLPSPNVSIVSCSFPAPPSLYVSTGNVVVDVELALTTNVICAQDVSPLLMEPSLALAHRRLHPVCPYNAVVWEGLLHRHGLWSRYHNIPAGFRNGFSLELPHLLSSQVPPNHPSLLLHHDAFVDILEHELFTGRYIGPFTRSVLHSLLGEFQTSPVSIIPKAGKPGRFRCHAWYALHTIPYTYIR